MSRQSVISRIQRVIAVPVTTVTRGLPSEVALGADDGMPRECVVAFDNVANYSKSFFSERICTLNDERMSQACRALAIATGCRPW
jgi:mRNA interferase MazF